MALREAMARDGSAAYGGRIRPEEVAITRGCSQAFCAAIRTLAGPGKEEILSMPDMFNHKKCLDMQRIRAVVLRCGHGMVPEAAVAARLVSARTRAIVLVSPDTPSGAEYPGRGAARPHGARGLRAGRGRDLSRFRQPRGGAA